MGAPDATMNPKMKFAVDLPSDLASDAPRTDGNIESPRPPEAMGLSQVELGLYAEICDALRSAGIEHKTAAIAIGMIVRTLSQYLAAVERCDRDGRTQTSPKSGWSAPTPWAEDERRLKMELGQWLPKACLTIPSLARVRKDTGEQAIQDDLFGALVEHATGLPPKVRH